MDEKDMIETEDTYYDGTRDEEKTEEVSNTAEDDAEEANDSADDGEEDYFDLDDNEEPVEDEETEVEDDDDGDTDEENEEISPEYDSEEKSDASKDNGELTDAVKNLLTSLGAQDADPVEAIKRLTAESMGISFEEFLQREAAGKAFEEQMQRDIDAIHEAFPATKKYKSLKDLPNKEKFAALMDDKTKKLTAVEAFAASHTDIVKAHSKAPGRGSDLKGTKDHMKSSVPKGAKDTSTYISRGEMAEYREMFPDLSDKEIKRLYKSANN